MNLINKIINQLKGSFSVGILIITAITILVYASIRISRDDIRGSDSTYNLHIYIDDSSGLSPGTSVRSAGIKIGVVDSISLVEQKAKIDLRILDSVKVYSSAVLGIKSYGILGDYFVDILQGSSKDSLLKDGDEIKNYRQIANIDQLLYGVGNVLDDIQKVTDILGNSFDSKESERQVTETIRNIYELSNSLNTSFKSIGDRIDSIIESIDKTSVNTVSLTTNLNKILENNGNDLNIITNNIAKLTSTLSEELPSITKNINSIANENKENIFETIENLQESSQLLTNSLENFNKTTKRIESGQGVVGRLINDEQTADNITETIEGLSNFIEETNRLKLDIGFRIDRLFPSGDTKGFFNLYYIPKRDHYYKLQLVSAPEGRVTRVTELIESTTNTGIENEEITTTTITNDYLISALIIQRYFDSLIKFGIIENKIGLGLEQYFGNRNQIKFNFDVWDFSREEEGPYLRTSALWKIFGNIYLISGLDDFLSNDKDNRQGFVGIGIDFNEDNLKLVASGLPISGLVGQ